MPRPKLTAPRYRLRRRGRYWTVSWTDVESGRTIAASTGQTEEAKAKIWRDQYIAELEKPAPPPPEPLISQIIDGYLADRKPRVVAYDRLEFAAKAINRHIANLEPAMLGRRTYVDRRTKEDVGDGTILREVVVLRAALRWAVDEKWIDRAPAIAAPSNPPPRDRWLTRDEVDRLILACKSAHVRLFVILAYHTAARRGAVLELTWAQVDFEHRRIDYRRPGRQTNKRRAIVPLNATVLTELQSARKAAIEQAGERGEEQPPAVVIEYHGRPVKSVRKGFAAACESAKIENCSPHVLRHTAATHMVLAGVPLAEISRMLGDSEAMIERVYGKHSPDYLRRAVDALAGPIGPRLISQTMSEKKPD